MPTGQFKQEVAPPLLNVPAGHGAQNVDSGCPPLPGEMEAYDPGRQGGGEGDDVMLGVGEVVALGELVAPGPADGEGWTLGEG